ncbi:DNA repair protein RecO [Neisseriaceae bacterium ESL0693]|nr:DNA repair protein RecO [Neisseriaceae bacterium ESL0693]
MPALANRINHQPAFLLATRPWRESSLSIEVFSRDYGRISLIARSARKRQSELRGILTPFVPLSLSWYGQQELKILHRAQWMGGWPQPQNQSLFSALYVNELVQKLTAREDPSPAIYQALYTVLQHISQGEHLAQLRYFEWTLLKSLGIAPDISQDQHAKPIDTDQSYWLRPEHAPRRVADTPSETHEQGLIIRGQTLQALTKHNLQTQEEHNEALRLTRMLLDFRLPEGIHSRRILQQLQNFINKNT